MFFKKSKKLEEAFNSFMKRNNFSSAIDLYVEYLDVLEENNKMFCQLLKEQDDLVNIFYLMKKLDKTNINSENKNILTTIYDTARNSVKSLLLKKDHNTKF